MLDAVLTRVALPLAQVLNFAVGDVLALPRAGIDRLSLVGLDGRSLSDGRLGQQNGMRAIRLTAQDIAARQPPQMAAVAAAAAPAVLPEEPLRQTA